jgi:SAM-dependent methyltransferase
MSLLNYIWKKFGFGSKSSLQPRISRSRLESNRWLQARCAGIEGHVLSIGSGDDRDGLGGFYRNYFVKAASYTTSEVSDDFPCDLVLDIRSMPEIENDSFDCVYCSGVLEHVDRYLDGLDEITRVLKKDGILLLGLPFRQGLHMAPMDFWRFTEFGIRHMLQEAYEVISIDPIDEEVPGFPAAYWAEARKLAPGSCGQPGQ